MGVARWGGTAGKQVESMKLPQGKGEWKRPRKASETIGISTLLRRRFRHIHSTLKVTAITAVMSFSIVRVS